MNLEGIFGKWDGCSHLEERNPTADSSTRQEMLTHHDDQGDLYGGEEDEGDHDGNDEGAKDVADELVGDRLGTEENSKTIKHRSWNKLE